MYTKAALLAFIGSAAAFNAPMMTVRRDAIATGAAAAVVAPLLRPDAAGAKMDKSAKAPVVQVYDERDGCSGPGKAPGSSQGLCVKVSMQKITYAAPGGVDRIGDAARDVFVNYQKKRGEGGN